MLAASACQADPRDSVMNRACPLIPAPRFTTLPPVEPGRKAIIAAADGLYVEAASRALRVRQRISTTPMPYGSTQAQIELANGPVPRQLLAEFIRRARFDPLDEIAAAIVSEGDGYALRWPTVLSRSSTHVRYVDDDIDDESIVFDLHSHGRFAPFFSHTDDASDLSRRGPYFALVVGHCDTEVSLVSRIVMPPHLVNTNLEALYADGVIR